VDHTLTDSPLQAVQDNKGAVDKLIIQTAERLLAVDKAVDQGIPDSAKPRMTAFAGYAIRLPKSKTITNVLAGSFGMKSAG